MRNSGGLGRWAAHGWPTGSGRNSRMVGELAMVDRWSRHIECGDHADRQRDLEVFISDINKIGISAPTPGMAQVEPAVIQQLVTALVDAREEALRRRGGVW